MTYRFVGSLAVIGKTTLDCFGKKIELTPEDFDMALRGHAAIIPEADFAALGFTDQDLRRYGTPGAMTRAPQEFKDRVETARDIYRALVTPPDEPAAAEEPAVIEESE